MDVRRNFIVLQLQLQTLISKVAFHCGTLEKSFAPKISGSAHCWRGASFRPIMTLHDEKSPKKVDSGCPPPSGSLQIEVQHQGPI